MLSHDKILENVHTKIEGLSSFIKTQSSFNKVLETQLAQLAAKLPVFVDGIIPGQPEISIENIKAVTTRGGKSTRDPPNPNLAAGK